MIIHRIPRGWCSWIEVQEEGRGILVSELARAMGKERGVQGDSGVEYGAYARFLRKVLCSADD